MTLPEFLLERIAEDEAAVADWPDDGRWGPHPDGGHWMDPNGRPIYAPRARVLAECEAKRRIVEECREESYPAPGIGYIDGERVTGRYISSIGLPHILRLLALPYADHPDYSEEWKP